MDLNKKTVAELKKICKEKNIKGYSKLRKKELINLLSDNKNNKEEKILGKVYCLINKSYPEMIKIGYTKDSIDDRIKQLSRTGVPTKFICSYFIESYDYIKIEKELHKKFENRRVNNKREFFKGHPHHYKNAYEIYGNINYVNYNQYPSLTELESSVLTDMQKHNKQLEYDSIFENKLKYENNIIADDEIYKLLGPQGRYKNYRIGKNNESYNYNNPMDYLF
jgi:hypothetical protein